MGLSHRSLPESLFEYQLLEWTPLISRTHPSRHEQKEKNTGPSSLKRNECFQIMSENGGQKPAPPFLFFLVVARASTFLAFSTYFDSLRALLPTDWFLPWLGSWPFIFMPRFYTDATTPRTPGKQTPVASFPAKNSPGGREEEPFRSRDRCSSASNPLICCFFFLVNLSSMRAVASSLLDDSRRWKPRRLVPR